MYDDVELKVKTSLPKASVAVVEPLTGGVLSLNTAASSVSLFVNILIFPCFGVQNKRVRANKRFYIFLQKIKKHLQ